MKITRYTVQVTVADPSEMQYIKPTFEGLRIFVNSEKKFYYWDEDLGQYTPEGSGSGGSSNTPNLLITGTDGSGNIIDGSGNVVTRPLTGFTTGPNSSILDSDTILSALGKTQGQIDATNTAVSSKVGLDTELTGFSTGTNTTITVTDTILTGFQKAQGQINSRLTLTSPITGYTVGTNTALAAADTLLQALGKLQGQTNARITLTSPITGYTVGSNTALAAADTLLAALGKIQGQINIRITLTTPLTGLVAGTNTTISATDTLLQAFAKLQAQVDNINSTNPTSAVLTGFSVGPSSTITDTDTILIGFNKTQAQINDRAPIDSPSFTGTPTAPTATGGTNTTQIATTAFVQTSIANKIELTSPITGYIVSTDVELSATDTVLQAFNKIQGQINTRIRLNSPVTGYQKLQASALSATDTLLQALGKLEGITDTAITLDTVMTTYTVGPNVPISNTDSIFTALQKAQGQINGNVKTVLNKSLLNGTTQAFDNNTTEQTMYLLGAGDISTLTITFPASASSFDGQILRICGTHAVTTLTLEGESSEQLTILGGSPTALVANETLSFQRVDSNTWIKI